MPPRRRTSNASSSSSSSYSSMDFTFGGKYRLEEELAVGGCGSSFSPSRVPPSSHPATLIIGTVFYGVHNVAGKEVAIKVEPAIAKHSPLRHESKIYKSLMGGPGVPWILYSGKQGEYNVMVIDLLGPSLEDLFKMCNRHFSLKTVLLLADQLVSTRIYRDLRGRPTPRTFHIRYHHFPFGRSGYPVTL